MPEQIQYIPVPEIDEEVLFRRFPSSPYQEGASDGVCDSDGLHVFELARPTRRHRYGLISGTAALLSGKRPKPGASNAKSALVAATIHDRAAVPDVLNTAIRKAEAAGKLSPMELGRLLQTACDQNIFFTHDCAVESLFPEANPRRRNNLRKFAQVFDLIDGIFEAPESLNQTQVLRLERAFRKGFGTRIRTILLEHGATHPKEQWDALLPILAEAEDRAA